MRNPFMKIQNPDLFFFEPTDGQTLKPKAIPLNFFKIGGVKIVTDLCSDFLPCLGL